jgi:uncharacterized protein YqhQ
MLVMNFLLSRDKNTIVKVVRLIIYMALVTLVTVSIVALLILRSSNSIADTLFTVQSRLIIQIKYIFIIFIFNPKKNRGMTIMNSMVYMGKSAAQ